MPNECETRIFHREGFVFAGVKQHREYGQILFDRARDPDWLVISHQALSMAMQLTSPVLGTINWALRERGVSFLQALAPTYPYACYDGLNMPV